MDAMTDDASPALDVDPADNVHTQSGSPVLILACDIAYAAPLATALRSIVEANPNLWPITIHILTDGFQADTKKKLLSSLPSGSALISWHPVELDCFRGFSTRSFISTMTYARLLIPRLLPQLSRVLYLDADILVLGDLERLWKTDLNGALVGAVVDGRRPIKPKSVRRGRARVEAWWRWLRRQRSAAGRCASAVIKWALRKRRGSTSFGKIPRVKRYFNAGILLIDLDKWREHRVAEKAFQYLTEHPHTPFGDQDALNVVCDDNWKDLGRAWNFQDHGVDPILEMPPEERPAIVHFVSGLKPWKPQSLSVNASFYDAFRSRTSFARTRGEKLSDLNIMMWSRGVLCIKWGLLRLLSKTSWPRRQPLG